MIAIRKATIQDAAEISYLIQRNILSNPNNYDKEQISAWVSYNTPSKIKEQFKDRDIYCAYKGSKLMGTIGLQTNEVVGFYIGASKRRKGIGQELFNFIENIVIEKKYDKIILTSTPSAVNFYKKNGFVVLKKITVTIDSIDYEEFTMDKNLKNR